MTIQRLSIKLSSMHDPGLGMVVHASMVPNANGGPYVTFADHCAELGAEQEHNEALRKCMNEDREMLRTATEATVNLGLASITDKQLWDILDKYHVWPNAFGDMNRSEKVDRVMRLREAIMATVSK